MLSISSTFKNRRPPHSSPPIETNPDLFLLSPNDWNLSVANTLGIALSCLADSTMSLFRKPTCYIVGVYTFTRYPDFTKDHGLFVSRRFPAHCAATLHTVAKDNLMVLILESPSSPYPEPAAELLHTDKSDTRTISSIAIEIQSRMT